MWNSCPHPSLHDSGSMSTESMDTPQQTSEIGCSLLYCIACPEVLGRDSLVPRPICIRWLFYIGMCPSPPNTKWPPRTDGCGYETMPGIQPGSIYQVLCQGTTHTSMLVSVMTCTVMWEFTIDCVISLLPVPRPLPIPYFPCCAECWNACTWLKPSCLHSKTLCVNCSAILE